MFQLQANATYICIPCRNQQNRIVKQRRPTLQYWKNFNKSKKTSNFNFLKRLRVRTSVPCDIEWVFIP